MRVKATARRMRTVLLAMGLWLLLLGAGCHLRRTAAAPPFPRAIVEYVIPRAEAFPNDPAVGADGIVWYTDRVNSLIGRLDPESGVFTEFSTPTPRSAPYGIAVAPDGAVWYAASQANLLGRLDPLTGSIREYPISAEGGPHTLALQGGRVWFTMRRGSHYGSLDQSTGEVRLYPFTPPPPPRWIRNERGPYAMVAAPDGSVWFGAMEVSALFRIDPTDGSLTEYLLADPRSWARRLAIDSSGIVWFTNFPEGRLGRLDPKTGEVEEYPSLQVPSDPYGIAVGPQGRIWYNEARHGTVIVFDPQSELRHALPIPTAGAVVRAIAVDHARGRVWLALSGTARLGRVDLPRR